MVTSSLNTAVQTVRSFVILVVVAVVASLINENWALAADGFPLNYSGRLTQASGAPVEGAVDIEISFFRTELDGSALTEPYPFTNVPLINGLFSVTIELSTADAKILLSDGTVSVFVEVSANGRNYPRQRFSFVPFALRVPIDERSLVYDQATGKLSINGSGTATVGQVLTSDGNGKVRWQTPSSNSNLQSGNYLTELVGDVMATGPGSGTATLTAVALPGTATKVTYDAKGRVTSGTSLVASDISAALGYSPLAGVNIYTGTGLQGGLITTSGTISLATTAVASGTYVRATVAVDSYGRVTNAITGSPIVDADVAAGAAIAQSKISGLSADLAAKEAALPSGGTASQFLSGLKAWQSLNTSIVAEDPSNKYYTDARARSALSGSGPLSYDATSGSLSISASDAVTNGYLSSSDWGVFNAKQNALGFTPLNRAGDAMTGNLNLGGNDLTNTGNVQIAAAKTLALGIYAVDPVGLVANDRGKTWFNSTTAQIKYWNGSAVQTVGAIGAALASLNGETGASQSFAIPGFTGTSPTWTSSGSIHSLNIPLASASGVTAGLLSNNEYSTFNGKLNGVASGTAIEVSTASGTATVSLKNTSVTAGTYTRANIVVDGQGRLTDAQNSPAIVDADISNSASIAQSKISGLSTSLSGKENTVTSGTTSQYYRGDKTWQELTTAVVTEGGPNLYYTDVRARAALSAVGPVTYSLASGAIGMTQAGSSVNGYISSSDWVTFNSKQPAGNYLTSSTGTLATNAVVLGNGTSPVQTISPGANGNVLTSDGNTWTSTAIPGTSWSTPGAIGSTTPNSGAFTTLTAAGNVGVGSVAPTSILDVNGAISQSSMTAPSVSGANQGRIYFDNSNKHFYVSEGGGNYSQLLLASSTASNILPGSPLNLSGNTLTLSTVPVTLGGTGLTTLAANSIPVGNGTSSMNSVGPGTQYQVLQAGASGVPTYGPLNLAQTTAVAGQLPVGSGGTGAANFTSNGVILGNGTSNLLSTSAGTSAQVLRIPTGGTVPAFGPLDLAQSAAVSGSLPVANGGTGLTAGTSGGVPYFNATNTMASSDALGAGAVVLGGGAGAAPTSLALGLGQLLIGNTTGAPTAASLTQTGNNGVVITPGSGSIALSTAQDIRTTASPTFAALSLTSAAFGLGSGTIQAKTHVAGANDNSPSATSGTLRSANLTGTDLRGSDLNIATGNGTGTGGSGAILFQTAPAAVSGSTSNAMASVMAITAGGNVGIGTTAPASTLETVGVAHVHDTSVGPDNGYNGALRVTRAAATGQYINLTRMGNYVWSLGTVYNSNNFAIGTGQSTDSNFTSPFFTINTAGNVGIGTTSPSAKLQVSGLLVTTLPTALTPSSTAQTIDWSSGNIQTINLSSATGNVTLTFSNAVAGAALAVKVVQGATPYNVVWPASVKWPNGTAPTISTTSGAMDLVTFFYDGTYYFGAAGQNYK